MSHAGFAALSTAAWIAAGEAEGGEELLIFLLFRDLATLISGLLVEGEEGVDLRVVGEEVEPREW